jgi:hydroxyacylglutathione hydrolase
MTLSVHIIPILKDNYAYILRDYITGQTAIVDPGEAKPVLDFLKAHALTPSMIINTHHHWDHVTGNDEITRHYNCPVYGPSLERDKIPCMTHELFDTDQITLGSEKINVIATPGHTLGHICLYHAESKILITADLLFSLGCGRIMEGDPTMMWASLQKIMALPDDSLIYCGHEYTLANATFCQHIEPDNLDLQERIETVKGLRQINKPSLPVTLGLEKKTNVFLRAGSEQRFADLRAQKDRF